MTLMSPYPDKAGVDCIAPYELVSWAKTWDEVICKLEETYEDRAKVVVIPDVTVQYFPDAEAGKPVG